MRNSGNSGWIIFLCSKITADGDCSHEIKRHSLFGRNDAKAETPVLWPPHAKCWLIGKDWCWEGLRAGGEGDNRGWDSWMPSPTRCTWVWVNSGSWWWTGRPGMLQFMGSQRVWHFWKTELNWTDNNKSNGKQVKEIVRAWSQNWLFPAIKWSYGFSFLYC